jgi:hypothetical protein
MVAREKHQLLAASVGDDHLDTGTQYISSSAHSSYPTARQQKLYGIKHPNVGALSFYVVLGTR